jgi:peroxiredoxin
VRTRPRAERPAIPERGKRLPDFTTLDADGRKAGPRDLYMRRNLALVFTHGPECQQCRRYLRELGRAQRAIEAEAGQAMIVVAGSVQDAYAVRDGCDLPYPVLADPDGAIHARYGLVDPAGTPRAGLFVADRYGTIFEPSIADEQHQMLAPEEVPGWLEFIACRCS